MQISEHFVGFPAANQANDIGVNAGAQECHGTAGTNGMAMSCSSLGWWGRMTASPGALSGTSPTR
jgi:hypothetical protein